VLIQVDDVLDDIVPVRILHQNVGVLGDLSNEPHALIWVGVVDASLEHAATMAMGAHLDAVAAHSIENELRIGCRKLIKALLYDVISVEVLNELNDPVAQGFDDNLSLFGRGDELNHLLQCPGAMLVQRNLDHLRGRVADQGRSLHVVTILEELLAKVVAERVRHQLNHMDVGLEPNHVDVLAAALFELLLEITASVLILAELVNSAHNRLKGQVLISSHGWSATSVSVTLQQQLDMHQGSAT
jgi:hypothetical protein